jgi:hypothetical protein
MAGRQSRQSAQFGLVFYSLVLAFTAWNGETGAGAQNSKEQLKPTEQLVRRYEKLIAAGDLLTPAGWKRASQLFEKSNPYPPSGEIYVVSTGGAVGEDWVKGDRAQVETKWDDNYGTIDSALRYKPPSPSGRIAMGQIFPLILTHAQPGGSGNGAPPTTSLTAEWKFEGDLRIRSTTIPAAIKYVKQMRDRSTDPVIRKNAARTIAALKRLSIPCPACAC